MPQVKASTLCDLASGSKTGERDTRSAAFELSLQLAAGCFDQLVHQLGNGGATAGRGALASHGSHQLPVFPNRVVADRVLAAIGGLK